MRFKSECWRPFKSGLKYFYALLRSRDAVLSFSCAVIFNPRWFRRGSNKPRSSRCGKTSLCSMQIFLSSFPRFLVLFQQVRAFQILPQSFSLSMVLLFSISMSALFVCCILIPCTCLTRRIGIDGLTDLDFHHEKPGKRWRFLF